MKKITYETVYERQRTPRGTLRTQESLDRFVRQFEIAKSLGQPPPSYQELAAELDVPYSSARAVVLLLVEQGRLVKQDGTHRGVRLP
jgi:DNA-binding IclR family transcriptional regulator